jgi:hypothetical protein
MVDDAELLELVEMEVRELLSSYDFPGDDCRCHRQALKALEGDRATSANPPSTSWSKRWTPTSRNRSANRQTVPDADRRRVLDLRARHGGHRAHRARQGQGRRRSRHRRHPAHGQDHLHRGGNVPQAAGPRRSRRQRGRAAARHQARRRRARPSAGQAQHHHPAHRTSKPKSTFSARKKAGGTRRSSRATGRNSTSAPPTSRDRSTCRKGSKW